MSFQLVRKPARDVAVGETYVDRDGDRHHIDRIRTIEVPPTIILSTYFGQVHCNPDAPVTIAEWSEPS